VARNTNHGFAVAHAAITVASGCIDCREERQNHAAVFGAKWANAKSKRLVRLTSKRQSKEGNAVMFNELLAIACTVIAGIFAAGAIEANIWK